MTYALPTFEHHLAAHPCPPTTLVLATHVLETSVGFIDGLARATDLHAVLGIPYSTTAPAFSQVSARHRLLTPPNLAEMRTRTREETLDALRVRPHGPVVLHEIGGYCAPDVTTFATHPGFAGVVEDTKQGHWRYAEQPHLPVPVLSIAESPLKDLENRQVGRSIAYSLNRLMRSAFHRLACESVVGVIGYGGIGRALARSLADEGSRVLVHDSDPIRAAQAIVDGFSLPGRSEVLAGADIVLGVSGQRSITRDDFALMRPGAILGSGSSKQIEIDVEYLATRPSSPTHEAVTEIDVDGKPIHLLNAGKPINFLDQSILGRVLDLVYTELYMCIRAVALGARPAGLAMLDTDSQRSIAEVWCSKHRTLVPA